MKHLDNINKNSQHEVFLPQKEFCSVVGISQDRLRFLREKGIVPSFGLRPVCIPLRAGSAAIAAYAAACAAALKEQKEG